MRYLLGDIGGTHIRLCLCDGEGNPLGEPQRFSTCAHLPTAELLSQWIDYFGVICGPVPIDALLLGIPTKERDGRLIPCDNLPTLGDQPLRALLQEKWHVPVFTAGDALCYAMGAHQKMTPNLRHTLTITLGTGVGIGWVINGKLYRGNGLTGEMWKAPYLNGMLEDTLSLRGLLQNTTARNGKELAAMALAENPEALEAFRAYGRALGTLLCYTVGTMDPECVLLGGGLCHAYPLFQEETRAMLRTHSLRGDIPIRLCPDQDGLIPLLGVYALYRESLREQG